MPASEIAARLKPDRLPFIWYLWAVVMLLFAAGLVSTFLTRHVDVGVRWGFRGLPLPIIPVYATMGALILARHPRHTVGVLLFYTGAISLAQYVVDEYAIWALLAVPGRLPGAMLAAWVVNFAWLPAAGPVVMLLPLLYPNGRLLSPRWRLVPWLAVATVGLLVAIWMLLPGPMESSFQYLDNPYGWQAGAAWLEALTAVAFTIGLLVLVLGLLSLGLRLRRAAGVERQQLKWFLFAAAIMAVAIFGSPTNVVAAHIFFMASILGLAVAVAAAILRYRLYDLDLLVNRTLVYAALTATLGALYLGSVLLLQGLFLTLTGEGQPQLVTVLSTLAIAALFSPVRRRLQRFIDRRFFRKKYDAARTLATFGAALRDETNLDRLSSHLERVIEDTMQPSQVSLWLKK